MSKSEKDYQKEIDRLRKQEQQRERERERERQRERERELRYERERQRELKDLQKQYQKHDRELNNQLKKQEKQHQEQLKRQQEQAEERAKKREKKWAEEQQKRAEEQSLKNSQTSYIDDVVAEKNKKRAQEKSTANATEDLSMTGVVRDKTQQGKKNMSSNNIKKNGKNIATKEALDDLELDSTEEDEKETLWEKIVDLDLKKVGIWVGSAALATLLVGGVGYMAGASSASSNTDKPAIADSVEGSYGLLEDVESMKDAQIRSLRSDLSSINDKQSDRLSADEVTAIERMNMDTANTLDPFFDSVLRISRNATSGEISSHQNKLSEYMTDSASTSVLYEFLSGKTPARDLGEDTRKSGSTMTFWVSTTPGGSITYFAVVPFVAESGTAKATYTVTVNSDNRKIDNITYNGTLNDGDAQFVEEALAEHKEQAEKSKNSNNTKKSRVSAGNNNDGDRNVDGEDGDGNSSNSDANSNDGGSNGQPNNNDGSATTGGDQATRREIDHGKAFCYDKGSELGPGNDVFC